MESKEFEIILSALLNQSKSKKQINSDIKSLEKVINSLRLVATFNKGISKKELNAYIKQLGGQLSTLKLKAKIDSKNLKREIDKALNNLSFKDIDALNFDENKAKLKVRKVVAGVKAYVEKTPITLNVDLKREKLGNQLTSYLNKNSKIRESEVLLKEADKLKDKISAINDKDSLRDATDSFQLFKSEVQSTGYQAKSTTDKVKGMISNITKIGSMFGIASLAINNFTKSLQTLKSNDTILTEISKTSEMTKQQLVELGNEAFKTASKYGQLSSNYLLGVQEMARSGYEDTSKELGELSLLAQSAGDMTAENANNFLLATDAAYKYHGSIEKLNAALDGTNYISNKNSASLTDIADGIRVSASYAANADVAIDELTAAEATMIATTKRSGSEMGRAFRSIILNLQQVSGEFDGEVIDEEQLKKVEDRCHSLGVELEYMKDGVATLRNPMEVLKDLARVYNSLPDNSAEKQGLISDIGGKFHANALSSLLDRWDLYEKMLSEYSQGAGSALEEANKTADSWEGRLNALQNTLDSFINSLTNKEAVKGGISFFDRLIQGAETLTNTIGEIPVLMTTINGTLVALNKDYGISQIVNKDSGKFDIQGNLFGIDFTAIKAQKKHFEEAGKAITYWNKELKVGNVDIESFNSKVVKNNAQLKEYLSTCSKEAPASLSGYQSYLAAAGVSTDALRLKTILLNSAIGFGIGLAVQAAVQGIAYLIQREEELRQATQEAATTYKDSATSIDDYVSKYQELRQALIAAKGNEEETYNVKKQLLDLQTELNDKFGDEYGKLNLVTDAYKDQTEAIKAYNNEAAQTFLNENREGIKDAKEHMTRKNDYVLSNVGVSFHTPEGNELEKIVSSYANEGIYALEDTYGTVQIHIKADAENAYDTINSFSTDVKNLAKELGDESLFDDILNVSSNAINDAKETVTEYGEIYKQALMAEIVSDDNMSAVYNEALNAVEKYNQAVLSSEDPYSDAEVANAKNNLDEVKAKINGNLAEWGKYSSLTGDLFEQADTRLLDFNEKLSNDTSLQYYANQLKGLDEVTLRSMADDGTEDAFDKLVESAGEYELSVDDVIDALIRLKYIQGNIADSAPDSTESQKLSITSTIDNLNTKLKPAMDSLESAWQDIFTDDGFTHDNVDVSMLDSIKSTVDELNKLDGINIDYSSFENLSRVLTDTDSTASDVKSSMNDFATSILYGVSATKELDSSQAELVTTLLESMGITNAQEIVTTNLEAQALQTQILAAETEALANGTDFSVIAFLNEAGASEITRNALFQLVATEQIFNNNDLNTKEKVEELGRLATAYGQTALAAKISNMETAAAEGHTTIDYDKELASLQAHLSDVNKVTVDFSGLKNSASKAGTESGKSYKDALKDELSDLNDVIGAIGDIIDDQIDKFNDQKDAAVDALEVQKEAAEEALQAEKDAIQWQIDAKQDEIDKIKEAAEERKNELDLQEKLYDLAKKENQKTRFIYDGEQMIYETDTKEIRDAREQVAQAKENIKIASIEKEISGLEDVLDSLDKKIEDSNNYYDALIEQTENYWDGLIKGLEDYKARWTELANMEEQAKILAQLEQMGISTNDILGISESAFQSFKTNYMGILTEMYSGNDQMLSALSEVANVDMSPLSLSLANAKSAIDDLGNADVSGVSKEFEDVTSSVNNAANAISGSGGGGSTGKSGSPERNNAGSSSSSGEGGCTNLKSAIEEQVQSATENLTTEKELFNGEDSLSSAVQDVITKIGGGDSESGEEGSDEGTNLMSAIQQQYDKTIELVPEQTDMFLTLAGSINECVDGLQKMLSLMQEVSTTHISTAGINHSGGGKAFADGTKALPHNEKNALRSEYGQPELTVYPNGTTELTTEPVMGDLPKGTVVFNEEQTKKIMNGKGTPVGKSYAKGTIVTKDGVVLTPLLEDDKMYKFSKYLQENLVPNNMINSALQAQTKEITRTINNISNITTREVQPNINIGDISVTCPGVTSQAVMNELGEALNSKFSGLHLDAYQRVNMR